MNPSALMSEPVLEISIDLKIKLLVDAKKAVN